MIIKIVYFAWKTAPLNKVVADTLLIGRLMRLSHSLLSRKDRNVRGKVLLKQLSRVSYVTPRQCKMKPRRENAESASSLDRRVPTRSTCPFSGRISRSPVTDHKSSRYRRVALLSGTLLNAATVNVRLGGIPGPVRYPGPTKDAADDQCGSIVASGLPWPGCIASIRLLRTEPSIANCNARIASLRNRYASA